MAGTLRGAVHSQSPRLVDPFGPARSQTAPSGRISAVSRCVAWAALLALASTLYRIELAGKRIDMRLRELKELYT
jgi:hypothetical protein